MAEVLRKPSQRITNMMAKELRLIVKDKVALFLIFLLPAALIGMLYWVTEESEMSMSMDASDLDIDATNTTADDMGFDMSLGLVDLDTTRTYDGEDLSTNFTSYLDKAVSDLRFYETEEEAWLDLYNQIIEGYVVIPDGFEANLTINEPTYIQVHVDATDLLGEASTQAPVQMAVISFRASKMWIRSEVFPSMTIEFTPEGGYMETSFGGFIVVFSSYLGIAMTAAQSIVGDEPLRRMLLTPTNRLEVITAKVLAYVVIGFFQSLLLITLWVLVFDLALNTGFETLIIIMSLTALTGSATGILISAISSSRLQANQMFLFILFATIILSGFFIEVGAIDDIMPLNLGLKLLIDTAFKGLSIFDVWEKILKIFAFSVGAILAASFIYSKKPTLG
ncbi:MAG: ABC transporter permease [Candidatus Thorarchaeota archaeon]